MIDSEKKFHEALKKIYIGVEIKGGRSNYGYINLLRWKKSYYDLISKEIKEDIEKLIKDFPDFKYELYDKLLNFFNKYFNESGSIYFYNTPYIENIYEKVYTNNQDVSLFWKTNMLYFVKNDRIYNEMTLEIDGIKFFFDISQLEYKKANEKKEVFFKLKEIKNDGTIIFQVIYPEGAKIITDLSKMQAQLKDKGKIVRIETLDEAFNSFNKQVEVDYFINKDARTFLREQFKLWLFQYVFSDETEFSEERIRQLKVLQVMAGKIINNISQFEDELVKIWNKPKFVLNSNYVITLDRIIKKGGKHLIKKIFNHENFKDQEQEWINLGIREENVNRDELLDLMLKETLTTEDKVLPLDTKYFKDLELEILALFENLDENLDGWLIKSENYQALNTILPKFMEKVQCIYIDPPFNKEGDADYFYNVKFKDSTWITMLENRLILAYDLLNETGSIFVRADYNGNMYVNLLLNNIFGKEHFRNEIAVKRTMTLKGESSKFHTAWETLFFYEKSKKLKFYGFKKQKQKKDWKWVDMHLPGSRKDENLLFRNFFGKTIKAPEGRRWTLSQAAIDDAISKDLIKMDEKTNMPKFLNKTETLGSNWTDIPGYSSHIWMFTTENSEPLLQRVIESSSDKGDIILDFFLGSGTTVATAHKLKRKWIGIEMGAHFFGYNDKKGRIGGILPRMKEVLAARGSHEPCGISKQSSSGDWEEVNWEGGGFFKYYELEQFERTLSKTTYKDFNPLLKFDEDIYNNYIFLKDKKLLETLEINYEQNEIKIELNKLFENIDIPETLSNLKGSKIKQIFQNFIEFEDGQKINPNQLDFKMIKPLIWW
ncbi:MAG: site-specific DNA-methyltransferase [Candidatus Lokiarchaeota archaeon]|nr:site-specific DNA-methyltransferase [Candidatus Lokiarchaeota archaeon]